MSFYRNRNYGDAVFDAMQKALELQKAMYSRPDVADALAKQIVETGVAPPSGSWAANKVVEAAVEKKVKAMIDGDRRGSVSVLRSDSAPMEAPWMDRTSFGVPNRYLVYGGAGLAALGVGYAVWKKRR